MDNKIIALRLEKARTALGLSQVEVANTLGISSSAISEWEQAKRQPSVSQLAKLASTLRRPISYFLEDREPVEAGVLWRDKPSDGIEASTIEKEFLKLIRQYRNLEVWTKAKPTGEFHELFTETFPKNHDEADILGSHIWKLIGLGDRPGESLLRILEETYGLKVFHLSLGTKGCAASSFDDDCGAAVLLNINSKRWRRNFDLAHELFHLVTWKAMPKQICGTNNEVEQFAQAFAGALLLPADALRQSIAKELNEKSQISVESMEYVARQFDVSISALFWRMVHLYRTPKDKAKEMFEKLTEGYKLLPKRENTSPSVYPSRYQSLAIDALRSGDISSKKYLEYMQHMKPTESELDELIAPRYEPSDLVFAN